MGEQDWRRLDFNGGKRSRIGKEQSGGLGRKTAFQNEKARATAASRMQVLLVPSMTGLDPVLESCSRPGREPDSPMFGQVGDYLKQKCIFLYVGLTLQSSPQQMAARPGRSTSPRQGGGGREHGLQFLAQVAEVLGLEQSLGPLEDFNGLLQGARHLQGTDRFRPRRRGSEH